MLHFILQQHEIPQTYEPRMAQVLACLLPVLHFEEGYLVSLKGMAAADVEVCEAANADLRLVWLAFCKN